MRLLDNSRGLGKHRPYPTWAVPYQLVHGVVLHPDVDHPRHPNGQYRIHPVTGYIVADRRSCDHRHGGHLADGFALGRFARICAPALPLLAASDGTAGVLLHPDPAGEKLVLL